MSENIASNMDSSQGTINYPTQLHLVGHFRKLYLLSYLAFLLNISAQDKTNYLTNTNIYALLLTI